MSKNITISTTVPAELKDELEKIAKADDRKISWVVRKAIEEYLEKNGGYDKKCIM